MTRRLAESKLLAGFIYGDSNTEEYIYLPGSELDTTNPIAIYENNSMREDVSIQRALYLIETRSLHLTTHPVLGKKTI